MGRPGGPGASLAPTAKRLQKILGLIQTATAENRLSPDAAHRLAGKLNFVNQTVFGKVGRAALAPIYARSSAQSGDQCDLTPGLRPPQRFFNKSPLALSLLQPHGRFIAWSTPTPSFWRASSVTRQAGCRRAPQWRTHTGAPMVGATSSGQVTPPGMTPARCQPGSCASSTPGGRTFTCWRSWLKSWRWLPSPSTWARTGWPSSTMPPASGR